MGMDSEGGSGKMIHALALTGPTASGKTALSIALARELGCEIISADSMQIYRGMDIGTAKATAEERAAVPHHLIDIVSPCDSYSTEEYRRDAMAAARSISLAGKTPLFVGGTGLYIDTLTRAEVKEVPGGDASVRESLLAFAEECGARALWERLFSVDEESALAIHENNVKRVIRALEIYELTGKPKSYFDRLSRELSADISVGMITLDFHDRDNLYRRVDTRVEKMLDLGLLDEVKSLYESGVLDGQNTASQAIGYKELIGYIRGENTLELALENLKLASRHYAKRQLTWFRHKTSAERLFVDTEDGVMKDMDELLSEAIVLSGELLAKIGYNR